MLRIYQSGIGSFDGGKNGELERRRQEGYQNLRGNMPVVEIVPSLNPAQKFEARVSVLQACGHRVAQKVRVLLVGFSDRDGRAGPRPSP